jgi:hypothetical protein
MTIGDKLARQCAPESDASAGDYNDFGHCVLLILATNPLPSSRG